MIVSHVEPEVFKGLLRYLYSGLAPESVGDIVLDLLLIADKYGEDKLAKICESKASGNCVSRPVWKSLSLLGQNVPVNALWC